MADSIDSPTKKEYEKLGNLMTSGIGNRSLGKNSGHVNKPDYNIGWDLPGKVPSQYADAIRKLAAAAKERHPSAPHTSQEYLARANWFGKQAMDLFLNDGTGSPLPRMLDKKSTVILVDGGTEADAIYHSYTGGDDLMLALLELYEANQPTAGNVHLHHHWLHFPVALYPCTAGQNARTLRRYSSLTATHQPATYIETGAKF